MTTTPGDKSKNIKLRPGQVRASNGVILGSGQDPDIPRWGADETDNDTVATTDGE